MVPHPARRRGTFLWAWPASAAARAAPKMTSDVCAEFGGKKVCSVERLGSTSCHMLPSSPLMYISFVGFVQWSDPVLCFTISLNKFSMSCSYEMWWCLIFLEESDDLGSVCLKLVAVCFHVSKLCTLTAASKVSRFNSNSTVWMIFEDPNLFVWNSNCILMYRVISCSLRTSSNHSKKKKKKRQIFK